MPNVRDERIGNTAEIPISKERVSLKAFVTTEKKLPSKGKPNPENEDYSRINKNFFIVCDGIGGHEKGQQASKSAVQSFEKSVPSVVTHAIKAGDIDSGTVVPRILRSFELAEKEIQTTLGEESTGGTTASVGMVFELKNKKHGLILASLGDSPTFVHSEKTGKIRQINIPHIQPLERAYKTPKERRAAVERLGRAGDPTQLEKRDNFVWDNANRISKALGGKRKPAAEEKEKITPNVTFTRLAPGDRLLACSDGIEVLTWLEIEKIMNTTNSSKEAGRLLMQIAKKRRSKRDHPRGKNDDITIAVIETPPIQEKLKQKPRISSIRPEKADTSEAPKDDKSFLNLIKTRHQSITTSSGKVLNRTEIIRGVGAVLVGGAPRDTLTRSEGLRMSVVEHMIQRASTVKELKDAIYTLEFGPRAQNPREEAARVRNVVAQLALGRNASKGFKKIYPGAIKKYTQLK